MTRQDGSNEIWFIGDPHGEFAFINQAVALNPPGAVILLGDLEANQPIMDLLTPAMRQTMVFWIVGNHDTDSAAYARHAMADNLSKHWINARIEVINGLRLLGFGGIFRPDIWLPPGPPRHSSYAAWSAATADRLEVRSMRRHDLRRHRSSIFPDAYSAALKCQADIVVSHEAPSCHCLGYKEIDYLATSTGARLIIHGHHHESYQTTLSTGVKVQGVADRQIFRLRPEDLTHDR